MFTFKEKFWIAVCALLLVLGLVCQVLVIIDLRVAAQPKWYDGMGALVTVVLFGWALTILRELRLANRPRAKNIPIIKSLVGIIIVALGSGFMILPWVLMYAEAKPLNPLSFYTLLVCFGYGLHWVGIFYDTIVITFRINK